MVKIDLRTSGVSLHFKKYKANSGEINGLQRHNERQPGGRHGNKNIDDARTKDNIFLIEDNRKLNKRIEDTIVENRDGGLKGVRKNAVRMVEGTVQLSGKALDQPEERQIELLKNSFEYLQDTFGKENFVSAVIHLDETTPHLHFDFVPIEDGRLTAKTIISPNRLRKYQADFLKHLQDNYSDLNFQRGTGEYNGLSFEAFKRLKDEEARVNKELDDREDALDDREDKLDEEVKALYQDKEKELKDKEEKLKQGKSDLDEKVKALYQDQQKLKQDKSDLADREDNVKKREDKVKKREGKVKKREDKVKDREDSANRRESVLNEATQRVANLSMIKKKAEEKDKNADKKLSKYDSLMKQFEQDKKKLDDDKKAFEDAKQAAKQQIKDWYDRCLQDIKDKKDSFEQEMADKWNNLQQAWKRTVNKVKQGFLRPEPVEKLIDEYDPLKRDDIEAFTGGLNDLADSADKNNQINL